MLAMEDDDDDDDDDDEEVIGDDESTGDDASFDIDVDDDGDGDGDDAFDISDDIDVDDDGLTDSVDTDIDDTDEVEPVEPVEDDISADDEAGDEELRNEIASDLRSVGIVPPVADPIGNPADWIKQLCAALKQKALIEAENDEDDFSPMGGDEEIEEDDAEVMEPDFATMGLDPRITASLSKAFDRSRRIAKSTAAKVNALEERTRKMGREAIKDRIDKLFRTGRMTKAEADKKLSQVETVKMSLSNDGDVKQTSIDVWLDARESLKDDAVWPAGNRLSRASVYEPPVDEDDQMTPDKARRLNDQLAETVPGMMRRKPQEK